MSNSIRLKLAIEENLLDALNMLVADNGTSRNDLVNTIINSTLYNQQNYSILFEKEVLYLREIFTKVLNENKLETLVEGMFDIFEKMAHLQYLKYEMYEEIDIEHFKYVEMNLQRLRANLPLEQIYYRLIYMTGSGEGDGISQAMLDDSFDFNSYYKNIRVESNE